MKNIFCMLTQFHVYKLCTNYFTKRNFTFFFFSKQFYLEFRCWRHHYGRVSGEKPTRWFRCSFQLKHSNWPWQIEVHIQIKFWFLWFCSNSKKNLFTFKFGPTLKNCTQVILNWKTMFSNKCRKRKRKEKNSWLKLRSRKKLELLK